MAKSSTVTGPPISALNLLSTSLMTAPNPEGSPEPRAPMKNTVGQVVAADAGGIPAATMPSAATTTAVAITDKTRISVLFPRPDLNKVFPPLHATAPGLDDDRPKRAVRIARRSAAPGPDGLSRPGRGGLAEVHARSPIHAPSMPRPHQVRSSTSWAVSRPAGYSWDTRS